MKKHGHTHLLRRGIAVAAALAVILLSGSSMVRADGPGERKSVRGGGGGGSTAVGDVDPDEDVPHDNDHHPQPEQDSISAEVTRNVRGGGQTLPREAGAESESEAGAGAGRKIEEERYLKKNKKNQFFVPPGQEGEGKGKKPAGNSLFNHIDHAGDGGGKLKKAKGEKVKDSYMVVFDAATRDADVERKAQEYTKKAGGKMKGKKSLQLIHGFAVEMTEAEAIAMSQRSDVKYVEEDQKVHATSLEPGLWGLERIDAHDSNYGPIGGFGAVVYVIDTGILPTHLQFAPTGRAFTSGEYDFMSDSRNGIDCNGHGTHCAGTVAGKTFGVAPGAHVVGVRVLDCSGSGSFSGVIAGINKVREDCPSGFATGPGTQGTPFYGKRCIASMSLGGGYSDSVNDAVNSLKEKRVPVAVAAGNEETDACTKSPASATGAITVGSTTSSDARSWFSNFGACVNIFAPGSSVLSAVETSDTATGTKSGTSMATPHVAGAAALILTADPNLSAEAVEDAMLYTAVSGEITDVKSGSPNKLLHVDFSCEFNAQCNDASNPCATGTCNRSSGACEITYTEGTCDLGDPCTSDTCASGQCVAGPWTCPLAQYDSSLGAPACRSLGASCGVREDDELMMARGTMGPGEPNAPNTLDGCLDGDSGTFHNDESNDALKVHTVSGNAFAEGEEVMITATVWAYSSYASDAADFYYAADATNPNWQYIETVTPPSSGQQDLTATYILPAGELQAVRVNFRFGGDSPKPCSTGSYDDTDDLAFAVSTETGSCGVDQKVQNNECVACESGTTNNAGDDASGSNTTCDAILCDANQKVLNNVCVACDPGTTKADGGDDASGTDTVCDAISCGKDEFVSSNTCVDCPIGTTNADGGDDASGSDTTCDDIDECSDADICLPEATCQNNIGSYTCECPAGFAGNGKTSGTGCVEITETPSDVPSAVPTPSPTSSCTYPNENEWLIITTATDWCTDRRTFGINEEITLVYYNANIENHHDIVDKVEVEFKAGTDKRKTKYKLDGLSAVQKGRTDLSLGLPRNFPDNTYRLSIKMGDIGMLGGWDDDFTPNNPGGAITPGEFTTYKFKVEDKDGGKYGIQSGSAGYGVLVATEATTLPPDPTSSPTKSPSESPTTGAPTTTPSSLPSGIPSMLPTKSPSQSPTTGAPTTTPSSLPSGIPSMLPTKSPSQSPTTGAPTSFPSSFPSAIPSMSPTQSPSQSPTTGDPTAVPSFVPSEMPSMSPTQSPSQSPTTSTPTEAPSHLPSKSPSVSPTSLPSQNPTTAAPVSSCLLPTKDTWLAIGINGNLPCSEIRTVNLGDTVSMVYTHSSTPEDIITNENQIKKLEVEFKVMGNTDRKTKWRIESNFLQTTDSNDHGRPHAFYDGDVLRFSLDIPVNLIGDIGGTENGDGEPLTPSQLPGHIEWKWKVETKSRRKYELRSSDNGSLGVIHVDNV